MATLVERQALLQMPLPMAIGTPKPAIDPQFCQLQSVGVGPALAVEGGPTPAEDGDFFNRSVVFDNDGRARDPAS